MMMKFFGKFFVIPGLLLPLILPGMERTPDEERAMIAVQRTRVYTEYLWRHDYNTDESKVRPYTLPEIKSKTVREWETVERPRLMEQFKKIMYGKMPPAPDQIKLELLAQKDNALDGLAIRKEIRIHCLMNNGRKFNFDMLLYVPKNVKKPPVFVGLNFSGNQYNTPEKDVRMTRSKWRSRKAPYMHFVPVTGRARRLETWNYVEAMKRGYAVATACYGEICLDFEDGLKNSCFTLFYPAKDLRADHDISSAEQKKCRVMRQVSQIGAWAWGLSRMLDALEKEPLVDAKKAAVIGHSRNGKAALWAGVCDPRFALTISNNSGCCGASLSRRNFGETLRLLFWEKRPWVAAEIVKYIDDPSKLPFDQHQVLAAVAPRYLYVASASQDSVADPKGEFLAAQAASQVWKLYGKTGLGVSEPPADNTPVGQEIGYHRRTGKHAITAYDWEQYYNFADKIFRQKGKTK